MGASEPMADNDRGSVISRPLLGVTALAIVVLASCVAQRECRSCRGEAVPVLRARQVVVEDEHGVARIVLGAPLAVGGAARPQDVFGIAVNDAAGTSRVVLGSPSIVPQRGGDLVERRSASHGMTIHDERGNERGGFAMLDDGTVTLMADQPDRDGAGAAVWRDGGAEVRAAGAGSAPTIAVAARPDGFAGLYVVQGGQVIGRLRLADGDRIALRLEDATGAVLFDAVTER